MAFDEALKFIQKLDEVIKKKLKLLSNQQEGSFDKEEI